MRKMKFELVFGGCVMTTWNKFVPLPDATCAMGFELGSPKSSPPPMKASVAFAGASSRKVMTIDAGGDGDAGNPIGGEVELATGASSSHERISSAAKPLLAIRRLTGSTLPRGECEGFV